ncbi:MAG: winged helix-turn-helix transcriptional regulator [Candidatus Aenigmarchaeota archaeon]|nr:winged helix-turn-helix transcriptional regulator [Candidatus Aenigmarchaeota archaeon]
MLEIEEKILEAIKQSPQGLTITEISRIVNIHRNTASKYVFALAKAGIIEQRRIGKVSLCYFKKNFFKFL